MNLRLAQIERPYQNEKEKAPEEWDSVVKPRGSILSTTRKVFFFPFLLEEFLRDSRVDNCVIPRTC